MLFYTNALIDPVHHIRCLLYGTGGPNIPVQVSSILGVIFYKFVVR